MFRVSSLDEAQPFLMLAKLPPMQVTENYVRVRVNGKKNKSNPQSRTLYSVFTVSTFGSFTASDPLGYNATGFAYLDLRIY